jgi:4-amino-4-deoxy-L-arabinose transferase-like glycosyltransferase
VGRLRVGLVLAAYPAAQLLFRLIATEGLEWDEAEQLVLSQDLALGYPAVAAQPPLYTWLQIGLFAVLGVNVLAVAGLRAILQIVTQLALYRSAHLVLGDRGLAVLAALSLWLVPQFSVESLAKTHSVLVTCLGALLVHALLRLGPRRRARDYAWLGAVLGLGALAKYNFPLVAAALLLGAATVPALRPALADRRLALALGVAVLLAAPHVAWVAGHLAQAGAHIGEKVRVETAWSFLRAGRGVLGLVWDLLAYLPPLLVALWVFGRPRSPVSPAAAAAARLIERFWLLAFVALVAAVFAFALPRFKEHWLQPFAFLLPLYLFCRAPAGAPPASGRGRYAAVLAAALVLLVGWRFVEA